MKNKDILDYYNSLAENYDQDRFGNSYGKYIHNQEKKILDKYLSKENLKDNIDIACGTGRFLDFADNGIDFSSEMVKIAKSKFTNKSIELADARELPFDDNTFKNALAFHLFMHLNQNDLELILEETHGILKKNGLFIFDVPSEKRRKLTKYKAKDWHGGFQISTKTLKQSIGNEWTLVNYHGIGFFPIHHIPKKLRRYCVWLDTFLCNSIFKTYSSHLIFILKKND